MFIEIGLILTSILIGGIYFVVKSNKREKIDLRGKHCVVTGGSSGIGRQLSFDALKRGAHVSIVARNKDRLNRIKEELELLKIENGYKEQNINIESIDISANYESTKIAFDNLVEKSGPIDVLINNAGIFKCADFMTTTSKEFDNMMRINFLGSVYCTKAVVDSMKQRNSGRIVFVSSQAGQIGIYGYTAYSATKFAMRGLAESLQMELKPYNIYITMSYPPDTNTPGLETENLTKPLETKAISESSGLLEPKVVSKSIIRALEKGSFSSSHGVNGFLLTTLTSGCGTVTSFADALIQITTLPICRLIAIILLFDFDRSIKACKKKEKQ